MRILVVISALGRGGAERQVVLLAREWVRRGHAVLVYTLGDDVPRERELAGSGVELVVDRKRVRLDPAVLARLRRTIRRWGADVVHGFLYDGNVYARLAGAGLSVPVLDSERNDAYRLSALQRWGYRLTAGLSDGVVANSHAGAAFARRLHRRDAADVHVVCNGIDLVEIDARLARSTRPARTLVDSPDARLACVVGAIKPQKDHALALAVAAELARRDARWRVLFVGDALHGRGDAHKRRVLDERRRLGLDDTVRLAGARDDVPELIASCDVLLATSRHEGFPNVVLEAMACGTPVASTDVSDVRRILPFGWQVASTRAPAELAAIVERCAVERDAVVRAQRRWVETHAEIGHVAEAMLAVYAGRRRAPLGTRLGRAG